MFQKNLDKQTLRSALLLGAASVAAIGFSAAAAAQEQSQETVIVTGSRIPQQGLYAPSPVTAVGQQELKFEGTVGVETLLNNLPSVFAAQTSGVSNGSSGTATVNLRDLGAVRTLVLVNSTRLMPGDPLLAAADLNQIPAALVDHVEVLTGGASAVYGSDAMAGVVNFVMRKDFEGIELDTQYGVAEADNTNGSYRALIAAPGYQEPKEGIWDGANVTGTVIMGANTDNGKGNVTGYVGYSNVEAVLAGARDFGACTFGLVQKNNHTTPSGHNCAGSSNYNRWLSLDDLQAGQPYGFFEQGTGASGTGNFVPFTGAANQAFNFGALNYLQRPDTRYTGGFFAHYEVNKALDVYSSFMFTDDYTVAQIAPSGLFLGTGTINGADVEVNCNNPLLTLQEATSLCSSNAQLGLFTASKGKQGSATCVPVGNTGNCNLTAGQALLEIGRRDLEGGNRLNDLRHTSYRLQIGAKGDVGDGWSYDVYAQYGYTVFAENYQNEFSKKRTQAALEIDPATGKCYAAEPNAQGITTDSKCVPLDIFNGIGSITPGMLDYVLATGFQEGYTEEQIVSGNVTGDLGEYGVKSPWAKTPVQVSFGSEYRAEYLQDLVSGDFDLAGTTDLYGQGGPTPPRPRSGYNVVEGFGEAKIPLVQEVPFVEDLSANAGYRYSSYSIAGSVSAYKYGLEYQPVDDIRFRASYERAVRAPNVLELFSPVNTGLFSGTDPCASSKLGQCASVPNAGVAGVLACPANQCNQQTGGNLSLRPEIGDTRTVGAVFTPSFIDGFTATVDYFNINVSHAIAGIGSNIILAQCYGANASAASEARFCPLVQRNSNGQLFGGGFVTNTDQNTGFRHTKGFDFEANYNFNFDSWSMTSGYGALQFAFVGTWLQSYDVEPVPGLSFPTTFTAEQVHQNSTYDCAGLYGPTCSVLGGPLPKWRHRLRVTWTTPWDLDLSANWRYLSGVSLEQNTTYPLLQHNFCKAPAFCSDPPDATINAFWYLDLAADWAVRTGVDLHAGVNNVFNRLPPGLSSAVLPTGVGNDNTFPGTYDSLGRTFFVGATIKY